MAANDQNEWKVKQMDEQKVTLALKAAIGPTLAGHKVKSIRTYKEDEVLTEDAGFTLSLGDGSEFQITVVQTAKPR